MKITANLFKSFFKLTAVIMVAFALLTVVSLRVNPLTSYAFTEDAEFDAEKEIEEVIPVDDRKLRGNILLVTDAPVQQAEIGTYIVQEGTVMRIILEGLPDDIRGIRVFISHHGEGYTFPDECEWEIPQFPATGYESFFEITDLGNWIPELGYSSVHVISENYADEIWSATVYCG